MINKTTLVSAESSNRAWGLRIEAGSRISFSLIDLNGESGRRNGMASLLLASPALRATVFPNDDFEIELDEQASGYRMEIDDLLRKMQGRWELPKVKVRIEQGLPAHSGCGSKTTTLLAIAKAYGSLFGVEIGSAAIAEMTGRGGTSGASVNLFDRGGYLVDGGHANPPDFSQDPHRYLLPSRYATPAKKPPLLIHLPFPNWPVLLIKTRGTPLHSEEELNWFKKMVPIPAEEVRRTAHHILMNLSTAVAEQNYANFCRAVNTLTFEHYFKGKQIELQPPPVRAFFEDAKTRPEIDALGLSVSGPLCFAFSRDPVAAVAWCQEQQNRGAVESYWFTHARNRPFELSAVVRHE